MNENEIKKESLKSLDGNDTNEDSQFEENSDIKAVRESLLDKFLNQVKQTVNELNINVNKIEDDLQSLTLSEYSALPVPTELEQKLNELQAITSGIVKKEFDESTIQNLDFTGNKVNYFNSLNTAQLAAVVTIDKPVLVIAGAGTGKTRVIVHRVSYLIEKGVHPQSILLLTFTRKAANEMLERVETLLHEKSVGKVTGGTFHSFASYVLRKYSNLINLPSNFTIIDTSDSEDVIDLIRSELRFNSKDKKFPKKSRIMDIISYSRNKQTTVKAIIENQYTGLIDYIDDIELIHSGYTRYKQLSHILDFDDLMDELNNALKNNQKFREILQNQYQYVMVDEFQDTNSVQNEIVQKISAKHKRIMVVGDDSQSIYSFRGANYENILRFPQVYPDCVVIKIEENYRSNQPILDFTNCIIDNSIIGFKKKLFTNNKNHRIPILYQSV